MQTTPTIPYDFGRFEGFNFRSQSAIEELLTVNEVLAWDHDRRGEAEFWPSGDRHELELVFKDRSAVSASELMALASLLDELGGDSIENFLTVYFAVAVRGAVLASLTADSVQDEAPQCFLGECFGDVRREAAFELFELYYPELYQAWESTPCDGLIFDTDRFLDSPSWTVDEVRIGGRVAVLVPPG
jgi:hypothetical protein